MTAVSTHRREVLPLRPFVVALHQTQQTLAHESHQVGRHGCVAVLDQVQEASRQLKEGGCERSKTFGLRLTGVLATRG